MAKFVLTGKMKGKTVVLGNQQYQFVNGSFECLDVDAEKLSRILCRYYGCTMTMGVDTSEDPDTITAKSVVKK